jgi:uncharacterized protein (TIGR00369 family)
MRLPRALTTAFRRVPVNRLLKLRLVSRSSRAVVMSMPAGPSFLQETGIVHGALVALLADTAAVYLVLPDLPEGQTMASIEFKLNCLRPGLPGAGDLVARSRLVQRGRQVVVCETEVLQKRKPVAKALLTYLIFAKGTVVSRGRRPKGRRRAVMARTSRDSLSAPGRHEPS